MLNIPCLTRRRRLRIQTGSAALLAVVVGAFAAGASGAHYGASATTAANASSAFVINMPVGPASLDPAEECGFTDITITEATYVRLTQYGSKPGPNGTTQVDPGHIVPYLAKSWDITKGGLVYTFHLRPGVKFADGQPLDAKAVKYSFERSINMGGCGGYFIYDGIYTPPLIKSITTPDALTVRITLNQADANVLQDWAQPAASIVDEKVISAHGGVQKGKVNTWMAGHVTPGGGPFLLQSYEANKQAVLVANPGFFNQPASKKVIVNFISSDPTLVLQARNGSADVTLGLSKQSAHSLASNSSLKVVANDTASAEQIGLPNDKPPFDNVKFREALTYAVPYQQILKSVAFGYGTLYYGAFPPAMPEFRAKLEPARQYNLAKAKSLIAASGVSTPVSVTMNIQAGNSIDEQVATIVQGIWAQLGVNVTINKLSASDYINSLEQHKAQSYVRLDGPGVIEAGYFLGYDMKCGIGFNLTAMCIKKADTLLDKGRKTFDKATRQKIWDQINALWIADAPKIPVYGDKYVSVVNKRVKSYFWSHEINFTTWSK
ncbi:MAG: ABC transporter substrate-binding protein [Gaiellaceae bacterium]